MKGSPLFPHAGLFLLLSAGIGIVLSAYGQDDVRRILRTSVRRFVVFAVGTVALGVAMALVERVLLTLG